MKYINLLRSDDFSRLTNNDIRQLEKEIDTLKEIKSDKKEWISKNISLLDGNDKAIDIIEKKILAGRITMKLFKVKLIYKKETILEKLQSDECNFEKININQCDGISIYSTLKISENKYIIRLRYDDGVKKHLGNEFRDVRFIDVIYHVDKNIIEVRADSIKSSKIIKFLGIKLQFTCSEVRILEKHKNINDFAKSIGGNFKKLSSNTAIDISELNEDDLISLAQLVVALDNYLLDKDELTFIDKVKSTKFTNGDLTFTQAFLAGCKQLRITVSNEDDGDVLNQGLYKVLSKYLSNDNGYITLKSTDKKQEHTIRVSTKSNTIQFVSSVDETIISKIVQNIVSYENENVECFDIERLSKEIDEFIKNESINLIRKEYLIEKFNLREHIIESILNSYINKGLLYSKLELISPITGIVVTELDNKNEIKNQTELLSSIYDINLSEENVDEFLDEYNQFIYTNYYINKENINKFSTCQQENLQDIATILEDKLNENEAIFIKKKTIINKVKDVMLKPKTKSILN